MSEILKRGPVVAIDGPAGTGKSSATKRLADALGFIHIDTGALYRSIASLMLQRGGIVEEGASKEELEAFGVRATELARSVHLEFKRVAGKNPANRIFADGKDITDFIRTSEVSMAASRVSAVSGVRAALLGLQRQMGCVGKSILEGRDIGTVIFPDADIKFFLTASVDERAKRRLSELEVAGADAPSFQEVKTQIIARDHGDSSRAIAPLKKAEDALQIDTSELTLDEVVKTMETWVRERLGLSK
ncbi:MAG: (d)CMP kinase [Methylotenera sp.]|nr:(d)CMP kinase [Oligoflexia bacterium]